MNRDCNVFRFSFNTLNVLAFNLKRMPSNNIENDLANMSCFNFNFSCTDLPHMIIISPVQKP